MIIKRTGLMFLVVALLSVLSCRSPLSEYGVSSGTASLSISLSVPLSSTAREPSDNASARVILPETSSVSVTVTPPVGATISRTVEVAGGTAELSLEDLPSGVPISILVEARDGGGVAYAGYDGSVTLSPGANARSLVLLPGTVAIVNPAWSRGLAGSASGVTFYQLNVPYAGTWGFTVDKASGGLPTSQILAWGPD